MKIEEIRELVKLLEESKLNMLEISEGDSCIRLEKAAPFNGPSAVSAQVPLQVPMQVSVPVPVHAPMQAPAAETASGAAFGGAYGFAAGSSSGAVPGASYGFAAESAPGPVSGEAPGAAPGSGPAPGKAVKSPMVGVFYSASAPGKDAFVSVGSRVSKGDVLCIVEAMKLMNEITAEESGEIAEICVEDGAVVEFGQPLFYLK